MVGTVTRGEDEEVLGISRVEVELEFLPLLGELLGGGQYRSRHLKWRVEVLAGEGVGGLFARLAGEHEGFARLIFDAERQCLREAIVVVLNDHLLDSTSGLDTSLADGDRLLIVPVLVGGTSQTIF